MLESVDIALLAIPAILIGALFFITPMFLWPGYWDFVTGPGNVAQLVGAAKSRVDSPAPKFIAHA